VINPANEQLVAEVSSHTPSEVQAAVAKASAAQREWGALSNLPTRQAALMKFAELLRQEMPELSKLLTSEMGKPVKQASGEIAASLARVRYLAENAGKVLEPHTMAQTKSLEERVEYEPLGVVANISAWNYPYFVATNVFAAAIATGNAVVYKPSELTPLTGAAITRLLHAAGVPEETFALVQGGADVGASLSENPQLDGVFFTGSNSTGRAIARAAAPNMCRIQLELGGKDPVYVRRDVDVSKVAAAVADGAFYNNGQSCCSVERIYVDKEVANEFIEAFIETVRGFKQGCPTDPSTFLGPLARKAALAHLDKQVGDAIYKGAKPAYGKSDTSLPTVGYFYPPTVLLGVDHSMKIMQEESFGPVIGIQIVGGDEEALALMNDTSYGLTASVYTNDEQIALRFLRSLNTGTGYWNCCDRVSPRLPWSGRRGSGVGSTLSIEGLRAFVRPKALHLQRS